MAVQGHPRSWIFAPVDKTLYVMGHIVGPHLRFILPRFRDIGVKQGWNCRGLEVQPLQFMSTDAHF